MSSIVLSLKRCFILGAGAILWVLGISGAEKVGRGYSAGVKRYVRGGADREWRVSLGQGRWLAWGGLIRGLGNRRQEKYLCLL